MVPKLRMPLCHVGERGVEVPARLFAEVASNAGLEILRDIVY